MNSPKSVWAVLAFMLFTMWLASCVAHQPPPIPLIDTPGFWKGLWHGFIAPVTFIVSLFSDGVRIYAYPNAGRWYDFKKMKKMKKRCQIYFLNAGSALAPRAEVCGGVCA